MSEKENDQWRSYLANFPNRTSQIKRHREKRSEATMSAKFPWSIPNWEPYEMVDAVAMRLDLEDYFQEVTLDFYENHDHGFGLCGQKKFIELVIIEESFRENEYAFGDFAPATNFLAEDKNKDVCTFQVYGLPDNENTREMFSVGTRLLAANINYAGHSRRTENEVHLIGMLNELDFKSIYPIGKKKDMCRFCGKENAKSKCSSCKVYLYCDRKCQVADWKLNHKLVCKTEKMPIAEKKPNEVQVLSKESVRLARMLNIRETRHKVLTSKHLVVIPVDHVDTCFNPPILPKQRNAKPICLKDMKYGNLYQGKVIQLTIIDEPLPPYSDALHFVVEDKEGDVTNLAMFMDVGSKQLCEQLKFGAKFLVYNPTYKRGAADGLPLIRVYDTKMIKFLGHKVDMCRFCGKEGAKVKCEECEKAYCDKKCQSQDKEVLKHELVCGFKHPGLVYTMQSACPSEPAPIQECIDKYR